MPGKGHPACGCGLFRAFLFYCLSWCLFFGCSASTVLPLLLSADDFKAILKLFIVPYADEFFRNRHLRHMAGDFIPLSIGIQRRGLSICLRLFSGQVRIFKYVLRKLLLFSVTSKLWFQDFLIKWCRPLVHMLLMFVAVGNHQQISVKFVIENDIRLEYFWQANNLLSRVNRSKNF